MNDTVSSSDSELSNEGISERTKEKSTARHSEEKASKPSHKDLSALKLKNLKTENKSKSSPRKVSSMEQATYHFFNKYSSENKFFKDIKTNPNSLMTE